MISGTGAYNRTFSVKQAIDAYISSLVHQAYLNEKLVSLMSYSNSNHSTLQTTYDNSNSTLDTSPDSIKYILLYQHLNSSFYETYLQYILVALEKEKSPEVITSDTSSWRDNSKSSLVNEIDPLKLAYMYYYNMNKRDIKKYAYYSIILLVRYISMYNE
jgi:hypothetical protein